MSFDDFLANWDTVEICHLSADSFSDEIADADDVNSIKFFNNVKSSHINHFESSILCHGENLPV